jgi:hypothetical protein
MTLPIENMQELHEYCTKLQDSKRKEMNNNIRNGDYEMSKYCSGYIQALQDVKILIK